MLMIIRLIHYFCSIDLCSDKRADFDYHAQAYLFASYRFPDNREWSFSFFDGSRNRSSSIDQYSCTD